jgi:hypothetical protein
MEWVLTGSEEHWQDSKAIGREAGAEKKVTDAELRMQGTTRIKKRKGKSSHLKHRPDRTKNEKRKALSNTKTE